MAQFLKQSTAFTFRIGPFVDSTDGVTAETALSIAQADIQISKAGGAFAQTSASPTTTHDADGWYQCPLTSTDTGTVGTLTVQIVMAGALPVWKDFMVLPANVYDSLVLGTDLLDANVAQWLGTVVATPTVAGVPQVDPTHWNGTAVATPDTAGYPKVTVKSGTGTGEISLTSGRAKIQAALQINTALTDFAFQMTDSTNHNPLAGLGDANVVVSYSHDGGETFTSLGFAAEGTGGTYYKTITTTAMNAARVLLKMVGTGADTLYILLETAP